ncbi:MAG: hypothetical protein IH598_02435 [Bacteroidales bacterium]|nr:hypothetical protein [Bacteroidales bacterium]
MRHFLMVLFSYLPVDGGSELSLKRMDNLFDCGFHKPKSQSLRNPTKHPTGFFLYRKSKPDQEIIQQNF